MAKLKTAMLEAETAAHLAAIIIDYTHEEIMRVFQELEANRRELRRFGRLLVKVDWLKLEVLVFNRRCKPIDADARRFNFVSVRCVELS